MTVAAPSRNFHHRCIAPPLKLRTRRGCESQRISLHWRTRKSLLRAGVDAFAHSVRDREVDQELLKLVRSRPAFVMNPSLPPRGKATDLEWLKGVVADEDFARAQKRNVPRPDDEAAFSLQARNLQLMKNAGVHIVLGTDTSFDFPNGNTPWAAHIEMEDMVAAGMTPLEVIASSTAGAAAFCISRT